MKDVFLAHQRTLFNRSFSDEDDEGDDTSEKRRGDKMQTITRSRGDDEDDFVYLGGTKHKKGEIVKTKIGEFCNLNEFYINEGKLSPEHCGQVLEIIKCRHPNGSPTYSAQPYSTQINDIKIHLTNDGCVLRSRIEDLYTVVVGGQLEVRATILWIDVGRRRYHVALSDLFDIPNWLEHLKTLEPMTQKARLFLTDHITTEFQDKSIDYYIKRLLSLNKTRLFDIKILNFKNDAYMIDILDPRGESLSKTLLKKFEKSIRSFELNVHQNELDDTIKLLECTSLRHVAGRGRGSAPRNPTIPKPRINIKPYEDILPPPPQFKGALVYFKDKFRENLANQALKSNLKKRMFPVKLLNWSIESLYFIPNDTNYIKSHEIFRKEIDALVKEIEEDNDDKFVDFTYKEGEICFFRNCVDPGLGPWLRGVIVREPKRISSSDSSQKSRGSRKGNRRNRNKRTAGGGGEETSTAPVTLETLRKCIYRVRSLDYGFHCMRMPRNLRPVPNKRQFKQLGPWSIRCKLFGVNPFDHVRDHKGNLEHTDACITMLDAWIRERITSLDQERIFHILFRPEITEAPHDDWCHSRPLEITLFHRFEPPYRISDALMGQPRRTKYNCLNYELTYDQGVADYFLVEGDGKERTKKSNIDYDYTVVNMLAPLGLIQ